MARRPGIRSLMLDPISLPATNMPSPDDRPGQAGSTRVQTRLHAPHDHRNYGSRGTAGSLETLA